MSERADRDFLHYFGVNLDVVWHIVTVELPEVGRWVEEILERG